MMAKRAAAVDDYDGPLLNGRPPLSPETVSSWFSAQGCNAAADSTEAIARLLIEYEFVGFYWKGGIAQQRRRRNDPSWVRNRRIADALVTLQHDLPSLIEDNLKVFPDEQAAQHAPFRSLLHSA